MQVADKPRLPDPAPARAPRYFLTSAGWRAYVYDGEQGGFVNTGLRPGLRGTAYPPEAAAT
jgi:hypothetical protein